MSESQSDSDMSHRSLEYQLAPLLGVQLPLIGTGHDVKLAGLCTEMDGRVFNLAQGFKHFTIGC